MTSVTNTNPVPTQVVDLREKFLRWEELSNNRVLERRKEIRSAITAVLARKHHFQIGVPGVAKCETGDTLVTLRDGSQRRLDSFVDEATLPELLSVNSVGVLDWAQPESFLVRDASEIVRLTLRTGRTIRVTPDHQFFDGSEWRAISTFKVGDFVATPRRIPNTGTVEMDQREADLLAFLIADGEIAGRVVGYTKSSEPRMQQAYLAAVGVQFNEVRLDDGRTIHLRDPHRSEVLAVMAKHGVVTLSRDKAIPDAVFQMPPEQLARFIGILWSGDGSIERSRQITYTSASLSLSRQLQHLLLRFGVVARVAAVSGGPKFQSWKLNVLGFSKETFRKSFGHYMIGYKRERLEAMDCSDANTNVDVLPSVFWNYVAGSRDAVRMASEGRFSGRRASSGRNVSRKGLAAYATNMGREDALAWATNDLFWDAVMSIEADGVEPTFCFTMPQTQPNFVANDIVTHNSFLVRVLHEHLDADVRFFEYLMTRYTVPDEIFGPMSLTQLKNDVYERVTTGKLTEADFAFLDESFKANSSILNSLLTVLNERLFFTGKGPVEVPTETLFLASNEVPKEAELAALWDRVTIRHEVHPIKDQGNFVNMLRQRVIRNTGPIPVEVVLNRADIVEAKEQVAKIEVPDDILDQLNTVRVELRKEGILPTERRFSDAIPIIQAAAWLRAGTVAVAEIEDMSGLQHVLWTDLNQQDVVRKIVGRLANPLDEEAQQLLDTVNQLAAEVDTLMATTDDKTMLNRMGLEIESKLQRAKKDLAALEKKSAKASRRSETIQEAHDRLYSVTKTLLKGIWEMDEGDLS